MDILKVLIEFVVIFLFIYAVYYLLIIRRCKKDHKLVPAEVNIIIAIYKLDIKKIDIYQMVKVVSFVTVLILSTIITLIDVFFQNRWILLIFSTLISLLVAFICYRFIGIYYKNKENNTIDSKKKK